MRGTPHWYVAELDRIERTLNFEQAAKPAENWWRNVRDTHNHDPAGLRYFAQQLRERESPINEFFSTSVFAQTEDLRAVLYHLDYKRIRNTEENRSKTKS